MRTTISDVAQLAGVSIGTVSNVLNRPDTVTPRTRARVEAAIRELDFVPNGAASQLRSGLARTVGLVVPDVTNPFFAEVARGASDVATDRDYTIVLVDAQERSDRERHGIDLLLRQKVRGVLLTPVDDSGKSLGVLQRRGVPTTLVDRDEPGSDQCSVAVDHERGGALGIQFLHRLGHRHIAWVMGPDSIPQVHARTAGVRAAAKRMEVRTHPVEVPTMTSASGEEAGTAYLHLQPRPTAIFCANDLLALGLMRVLRSAGVEIGSEVSVMGYDDIDFCAHVATPLTSIRQPAREIGSGAARLLLDECDDDDDHVHQRILFEPVVAERFSTQPPPGR